MKSQSLFRIIIVFVVVTGLFLSANVLKFSYIGAEMCGLCHKTEKQGNQFSIWKNSKHSNAYRTLLTDEANQIAKQKGYSNEAKDIENCLKCHASGYKNSDKLQNKFKVEDGVQCETCHGPGSDYKDLKTMKDRNLAFQNGLIVHKDIEKHCRSCHNSESPTHKGFDFEKSWNKIKHKINKGN